MGYPPVAGRSERLEVGRLGRLAYTAVEVADMLGVSADTVTRLVRANRLPHKRLGRRIVVPAVALEEWLASLDDWASDAPGARSKS